jgi:hypothetical protein
MRRLRTLTQPTELVRITSMLAIWIGLHLYAARPLLVAAASGGIAPTIAWSFVLLLPFISVLPLLSRKPIAQTIGYGVMSLLVMLLIVVFFSDLLRIVMARRLPARYTLGIAAVLALIGFLQARRPRVVSIDIPSDLDGYRIVQWSDVHIGPTIQRCFVESLVRRTNALDADAVVITGDLIDGHVEDLRDAIAPLQNLRARDGVFVVTGNHEYYWRASEWVKEFARLGMTFLKNEHRVVRDGLVIAGVTDPAGRYTHTSNLKAALDGAPRDAFRVLLAHRPQVANAASRNGVDLQLSGHTHGGQFFPFNLLIRWFQPVVAGLHRVGETLLYVSRGTGYWGPPSRLGVGGEITLITLGQK